MSTDKPHLLRLDNQEIRPLAGRITIGRHPACDYVLSINDGKVGISGRHASIDVTGDGAWLEDLGSTNGTWVQEQRITQRTPLATGTRFRLDTLEFEFRAGAARPDAPPPPPPEPQVAPTMLASREALLPKTVEVKSLEPQKFAGAWINADPAGKTKFLQPEERARLREKMGSGLYAVAEAVSVPTLLVAGPEPRRVALAQRDSATQEWTIGSNADADVSIALDGVSGLHAKILRNGQTWTVSDLMSANGTFVDGQKINRSHLQAGSQLGFGPVLCTFLLPEGAAAKVPAAAQPAGKRSPGVLLAVVLGLAALGAVAWWLLR
jgi:pSer/pThr/pTyr-binding forkhead associated (FHA) protein